MMLCTMNVGCNKSRMDPIVWQERRDEAEQLGYPDFARIVQKMCLACREDEANSVYESLVQLTELTRCIRLGHRGAA